VAARTSHSTGTVTGGGAGFDRDAALYLPALRCSPRQFTRLTRQSTGRGALGSTEHEPWIAGVGS